MTAILIVLHCLPIRASVSIAPAMSASNEGLGL
jgi:hypothetical protein